MIGDRQIHVAGAYLPEECVQYCSRCGDLLTDNRGAMIPIGDPPLNGWAEGAKIEIIEGNPRQFWTTDDDPTCDVVEVDSVEAHGLL